MSQQINLKKLLSASVMSSALALFLVGCQQDNTAETTTEEHAEHHEHEHDEVHDHDHDHAEHHEHEHAAHDHHDHDHDSNRIEFDCEPDKDIGAFYHTDSTPQTAHLLIDGIEYDLTEMASTPNQTFIGEVGLDETHGLVWQTEGNRAVLYSVPTSDVADKKLDNKEQLFSCEKDS